MKKRLVYDFPTRVFHWMFASGFIAALAIAKTIDADTITFTYHMLIGLTLGFLVSLRILWGLVGTKHAKFSDFSLGLKELGQYFIGILRGDKRKWAGHNPASSWAALSMMALALSLAITGFLMTSGGAKEDLEDIHEWFAHAFLVVALMHVGGIILHTLRHREMIGLSMIDGNKLDVLPEEEIERPLKAIAIVSIALVCAFGFYLFKNFDSNTGSTKLFGVVLKLR